MQAYRVVGDGIDDPEYTERLKEAHEHAKTCSPRDAIRVELIEFESDKAGIVAILNQRAQALVLRTWRLTPRGGLTECPNGE